MLKCHSNLLTYEKNLSELLSEVAVNSKDSESSINFPHKTFEGPPGLFRSLKLLCRP